METKRMSLANIQGKLTRAEMKNILAGREDGEGGGTCFLRCDQNTDDGIEVSNCSKSTVDAKCSGTTTPVCICG